MANGNGPLDFKAVVDNTDFNATIAQIKNQLIGVGTTAEQQATRMDNAFAGLGTVIAGAFTAVAAEQFVQQLIRVRGEFQQLEIAFTTMLKSKEKADQLMQQVKTLAATTPFELNDVATGAKQLLAYGFQADQVTDTIKKLGDVAAGVSAPLNDIVYLYGTLRTQGVAYAQDIRQFTNRGIPIIQALADEFGVAQDKVMDLVSAGKVGFPEVEKAIDSMTSKTGQFYNLMKAQSASLTGQVSNLHDSIEFMINDIGTKSQGILAGGISLAASLVANYKEIFEVLGTLVAGYGAYKAAVIATTVAQQVNLAVMREAAIQARVLTTQEALMAIGTKTLRATWNSLTAAMASNPIGAIAVALTATVVGLELVLPKMQKTADLVADLNNATSEYLKTGQDISDLADKYESLSQKTNRTEKENADLNDTMQKLAESVPGAAVEFDNLGHVLSLNLKNVQDFNSAMKKSSEIVLQNTESAGEQRLKEISQQIAYFQRILNTGTVVSQQYNQQGAPTLTFTRQANDQDRLEAAKQVQELGKEYSDLQQKVEGAKKALAGTFTIYQPPDVNAVQTVAQQVAKVNAELKAQQDLLTKQRLPASTATSDQIEATLKKVKELKAELLTLTGPAGTGPAPKVPVSDQQFASLAQAASNALKASMKGIKQEVVDVGGDVMKKVMDNWNRASQTEFDLTHTNTAAAYWKNFWTMVMEDPFNDTVDNIKNKIGDIDKVLKAGGFTDPLGDFIKVTPAQVQTLQQVRQQLQGLITPAQKIRTLTRAVGDTFKDLANGVGSIDSALGDTIGKLGDIVTLALKFADSAKKAQDYINGTGGLQANSLAGLTSALSATTAAVSIMSTVMGAIQQQQLAAEQQRIDNLQTENDYLREQYGLVQKITGAEKAESTSKLQDETRQQIAANNEAIQKEIDNLIKDDKLQENIFNKKKKRRDEEHLQSVSAQLDAALEAGDYQKYINILEKSGIKMTGTMKAALGAVKDEFQLLTDSTDDLNKEFTGLSIDDLTSKIVDMFQQGKISAEDFASTFEDVMKGAILNTFQSQFLQKQLATWYQNFSDMAQSGDKLTSDEVAQLRANLTQIFDDAKTGWDQLQQAAGLDFSGDTSSSSSPSSLEGAVKGITADQAGIIAGQFNAMRITQADVAKTVKMQLETLSSIEVNTRYNQHLESIDRKLDALDQDVLRAKGITP